MKIKMLATCLILSACADLPTAAELSEPQILALTADPPGIAPGEESRLGVVVAAPEGLLTPARVSWTLPDPKGAILIQSDGWSVVAPDNGDRVYIRADVTVELDDGTTLLGYRTMLIGEAQAQPTITDMRVDGERIDTGQTLQLSQATHELTLDVAPPAGEDAIFSWFSNVGELTRYRRSPAFFETADAEDGTLVVVYRDGKGGIATSSVRVQVP